MPVAVASIYSYVNPLVAVLLGVWLYGERFTAREGIAMGIIFAGVALVKRAQRGRLAKSVSAPFGHGSVSSCEQGPKEAELSRDAGAWRPALLRRPAAR